MIKQRNGIYRMPLTEIFYHRRIIEEDRQLLSIFKNILVSAIMHIHLGEIKRQSRDIIQKVFR